MMKGLLAALVLLGLLVSAAAAEEWAFAVIGDVRSASASYRNVLNEIRTQTVNPEKAFPFPDLVVACGDLDPVQENFAIFREVFKNKTPAYFPVRGNHESPEDLRFIVQHILPPYGKSITRQDEMNINYFTDWKNVRLIVLDQYSSFGKFFDADSALKWIENALKAPAPIRHIFIAFHEPYLPFYPDNDPFWSLLAREDRVKAVFAGHTHIYQKRRFPEAVTGTYHVNVGNAGQANHSDRRQTIVEVMINGETATFRVLQAPDGTADFSLREEWEIAGRSGKPTQNGLLSPPVFVKADDSFAVHHALP
jgi:predicted phosphodiesterase